ncbi:AmmeMemoRadiSam system protein A [Candidatus Woesearchaeota archaeon]|nr:AmmeMemoRadiSam system protein A [Candidatus Woesearchaeota archaeon]
MFSDSQKTKILRLARQSISSLYDDKQEPNLEEYKEFSEEQGVFVTLKKKGELRGCIGYAQGYYSLNEAILKAARAAAINDTRFDPLRKEELDEIKLEVSILTKPEMIKARTPEEILKEIVIGEDGLILERSGFSGLLLPQVPEEQGWDAKEYLENLSYKAGLNKEAWREPGVKISKFQAIIIEE